MDAFYLGVGAAFFLIAWRLVAVFGRLQGRDLVMTWVYAVSGALAGLLFIYLLWALLRPEKF